MPMIDTVLMELDNEGATTRRLLERVPNDKLAWKPHPKARSLGELAVHIAQTQKHVSDMLQSSAAEVNQTPESVPGDPSEIVRMFDDGLKSAKSTLGAMSDADLMSNWSLVRDGKPIFSAPKIGVIRMIVLNHVYHHRGQLSTYLRELGVSIPSIYGPSADENPFA